MTRTYAELARVHLKSKNRKISVPRFKTKGLKIMPIQNTSYRALRYLRKPCNHGKCLETKIMFAQILF